VGSEVSSRHQSIDRTAETAGQILAPSSALHWIEEKDECRADGGAGDEAQSLHDWSMAGARSRLP